MDQTTEMVSFTIPQLPKSVNKQYFHTRWNTRLRPEVHAFRQLVSICMGAQRTNWKPRGTAAAILIFQSPNWITKDRTIRQHDLDNRVKPILDAVNAAAHGSDDCQYWDVLAFKMVGANDQVFVMLFDLGDVVEYKN
jgi:Holliday junction resolvase RusA-like endonuclease